MKLGIIGFGRLGKLLTKFLAQDFDVVVHDLKSHKKEIEALGAKEGTFEEVCSLQAVMPLVPISEFEGVIKKMVPHLAKDAIVIDGCSVKKYPIEWMKKHLPKNVEILGTHPMFGPDSASKTLYGSKIVLCPARIDKEKLKEIIHYLEFHGLRVIESTPDQHDKEISHSLVLAHYIGRGLIKFDAKDLLIDTKGYRRLMKILETVENDTWQLFLDMNKYNPYAKEAREEWLTALTEIHEELGDD